MREKPKSSFGSSIHGQGITPDVTIESDATRDLLAGITSHQTRPGAALLQGDSQLNDAFALLREGRIVQGRAD